MKKRIGVLTAAVMLLTVIASASALAEQDIRIMVNGEWVVTDRAPFIENDRTLVPVRGIFEKLGAEVKWTQQEQLVEIAAGDMSVLLNIGKDTATIIRDRSPEPLTETIQLEVPARLVGDRTFLPVRFVVETLGGEIGWDGLSRVVNILTPDLQAVGYQVVSPQQVYEDEDLHSWYDANRRTKGFHVYSADGETYVLVAAGEKPTGGYSLDVRGVYLEEPGTLLVKAAVNAPAPDMMVIQVFTYPGVLIRLDKEVSLEVKGELHCITSPGAGGLLPDAGDTE